MIPALFVYLRTVLTVTAPFLLYIVIFFHIKSYFIIKLEKKDEVYMINVIYDEKLNELDIKLMFNRENIAEQIISELLLKTIKMMKD